MLKLDRLVDRYAPNWLIAALLAVNYTGVTALVYLEFRDYPDHSATAIIHWAFLYFVALVQPVIFGLLIARGLRDQGLTRRKLRFCTFAPGIVGGVTLLIALSLIG
jgi:hypothetical protein